MPEREQIEADYVNIKMKVGGVDYETRSISVRQLLKTLTDYKPMCDPDLGVLMSVAIPEDAKPGTMMLSPIGSIQIRPLDGAVVVTDTALTQYTADKSKPCDCPKCRAKREAESKTSPVSPKVSDDYGAQ
jgi:hypothetical protein